MSIRLTADVELTGGVRHKWFPADGKGGAFGTIDIGAPSGYSNCLYFDSTGDIDELIAELVALKQEMEPPADDPEYRITAKGEAAVAPLPWTLDADGSHWRAELPDGRTGVIAREQDGDENGNGAVFVPRIHESAQDFIAGPECAGVLAAAQWCTETAAAPERETAASVTA